MIREFKLRRIMLIRLAKSFDSETSSITIGKTPIPITAEDVHHIFGLAIEGEDIDKKLESAPEPNLFNTFQKNGSIDLADLEREILSSKTPDNDFLARFVLFTIGTVLAPTTQSYVDAKYLKRVADIKSLPRLNWGCFTMKHLFMSIHKFNSLDQVSLQGNLPLLQIWYWEHLLSGKLMYTPIPPPLVARWDECTCVIRAEAYTSGGLHKGLVVMEICARQPEANNRKDPGSQKFVRVHEGIKNKSKVSRQSESQKAGVEEQVNVCNDPFMATPKFDASTPRTSTPTPSARHVLPNKDDPRITPMKPLFDNDYVLTAEDKEAAIFIRGTHGPVEVIQIGDIPLRAEQLKPIYDKKYICGDVIMPYAHISGVGTDTTSVISRNETRKLLQTKGVIPKGHGSSWVQRIANKFVGRRKVDIPLNVNDNHWMAMVFNFDKEEIQILNSLKNQFDESKKTALVEAIQACMDEAVKDGLVTPAKPIKFTDWEVVRYDDMPQYSQIDIFSWKIVSSLLRSDCNSLRMETYKYPITAETYEAHVASQPMGTVECKMSDMSSSPKDPDTPSSPKKGEDMDAQGSLSMKCKLKKTKTMEELRVKFDSKTIAKQVASSMLRRSRKPLQAISSHSS
uniref:Ubiquitin-like protease family profile domain-containing protein n=1 Tax=Aegilops tauschii TaxID=37682 RepID=M8C6F5_AEGTA